jgi:hypothetical protein
MTEQQIIFIKSYDFMRLGQAINHENWSGAGMTAQRMQKQAAELEMPDFERLFRNLKMAAAHREKKTALDILAQVTAKRVQLMESLK